MTFVNLGASEGRTAGAHRAIPGGREQARGIAAAKAIGAFPAHADGGGGGGDAIGAGEDVEEAELAVGSPAVPAAWLGNGAAIPVRLHRPVWSTKRRL